MASRLSCIRIQDTAGQERFSSLSSAFFRGADAAVLMFDVNKPESLRGLRRWWDDFKRNAPVADESAEQFCCVFVGNKIDLVVRPDAEANGTSTYVSDAEVREIMKELVPLSPSPDGINSQSEVSSSLGVDITQTISGMTNPQISIPRSHPNMPSPPFMGFKKNRFRQSTSRSTERLSYLTGTMETARTSLTVYHTPSSSLFNHELFSPATPPRLDSAGTSSSESSPPSRSHSVPRRSGRRHSGSESTTSSTPTITPSLFLRSRASASSNTSPDEERPPHRTRSLSPHIPVTEPLNRINSRNMPPKPERGPALFYTSAKTGHGVSSIFEYVASRAVRRLEYEEAFEARLMHVQEGSCASANRNGHLGGATLGARPLASSSVRLEDVKNILRGKLGWRGKLSGVGVDASCCRI